MNKKKWIISVLCFFFIVGGFLYTVYRKDKLDVCLSESGKKATGAVADVVFYKGKNVKIYFTVDGKRYLATGKAYDARDPVNMGDKFQIHYCEEDPSMNRILLDQRVLE